MTTLMEPMAPWLRDLNRLFTADSAVDSFLPPAGSAQTPPTESQITTS